jgi:hypothetical protein
MAAELEGEVDMKKIQVILCAMLLVFGTVGMSHAARYIYTFSGTVSSTPAMQDTAGLIAEAGIEAGDPVEYTWLVDFDAEAYVVYNSGAVVPIPDNAEFYYFYAEYISGSLMGEGGNGYYNNEDDVAGYYFGGVGMYSATQTGTALGGGSKDDYQYCRLVASLGITLEDVPIGTAVEMRETSYNELGEFSEFWADCTISSIESIPIPPCEGDFDGDRDVDESDLTIFAFVYGITDCNWWPPLCVCDFDDDDDVDGGDLSVFNADFGRTDCPLVDE